MEQISPEDDLYRRLAPLHINIDGSVNSAAYKLHGKPDPSVSVDLARLTTVQESLDRAPTVGFFLGQLRAAVPMAMQLDVRHDPVPENPSHSLIEGNREKTKCRQLAAATTKI